MQTIEVENRDRELKNIAGNLMIVQYQVDKLRNMIDEKQFFIKQK